MNPMLTSCPSYGWIVGYVGPVTTEVVLEKKWYILVLDG